MTDKHAACYSAPRPSNADATPKLSSWMQWLGSRSMHYTLAIIPLAVLLSACSFADPIDPPPGSELTAAEPTVAFVASVPQAFDIAAGEAIFAENCTSCHGANGAGNGEMAAQLPVEPLNFTDHQAVSDRTPDAWYQIITQGNLANLMPPWQNALSDQERWNVTAYLYTLSYSTAQAQVATELLAETDVSALFDLNDPTALQAVSNATIAAELATVLPTATERELLTLANVLRTQASTDPLALALTAEDSAPEVSVDGDLSVINGRIVGTDNFNDLWINLQAFAADGTNIAFENPVADDGSFNFELTNLPDETALIAQVEYEGVTYLSNLITADGSERYDAEINVFPASTDASLLEFAQLNLILEPAAHSVQVTQLVLFENNSDQTIYNAEEATFNLDVPLEAVNVNLSDTPLSRRVEIENNRLHVNAAFPPASAPYELLLSYSLPMQDGDVTVRQPQLQAAAVTRLLIPAGTLQLTSEALQRTDPITIEGVTYDVFLNETLADGQLLRYSLEKPSQPIAWVTNSVTGNLAVGLLLVLLVLGGSVWWLRQERVTPQQQYAKLVAELATLDAQAEALKPKAYASKRAELKSDLLALLQHHPDLTDVD